MTSQTSYYAQNEQIYLFERLRICRDLAAVLCASLKNNELSQYIDKADAEAGREKIREIQWRLNVLAEAISAALDNTKTPSNEVLLKTLEWVKNDMQGL
ncbi:MULTISPECIES: hypothetical protein [unclassified Comamonas]|uniref:hypothetical protein n=1 Tax=unclassified Comamonas TaxID=2638500 RepID=UPI003C703506